MCSLSYPYPIMSMGIYLYVRGVYRGRRAKVDHFKRYPNRQYTQSHAHAPVCCSHQTALQQSSLPLGKQQRLLLVSPQLRGTALVHPETHPIEQDCRWRGVHHEDSLVGGCMGACMGGWEGDTYIIHSTRTKPCIFTLYTHTVHTLYIHCKVDFPAPLGPTNAIISIYDTPSQYLMFL